MKFLFLPISFVCFCSFGQRIDNTASFRNVNSDAYFRINYENDLFAGQDENYTQGFSLEFVSPILSKNPFNNILFGFKNVQSTAGITLEHNSFTPKEYQKLEIQTGDRPFAAVASIKSFRISSSEKLKQRLVSSFHIGVIGPAAQGEEIQIGIHRITNSTIPLGWNNQIENQLILNYGINYEKSLVRIKDNFGLNAEASLKIGNLYSNLALGFNTTFGIIKNPYQKIKTRKFLLYAYAQPVLTGVGYNATMQGGYFGKESIYTIHSTDIKRLLGQINYGLILQTKLIYLELSVSHLTEEVKSLGSSSWGGVKLGFGL